MNRKNNGTSKVKENTWDIHFNNVQVNSSSVTLSIGDSAATINAEDDTLVEYTVTLNIPGDFYEFTVDVVNNESIDGMVERKVLLVALIVQCTMMVPLIVLKLVRADK